MPVLERSWFARSPQKPTQSKAPSRGHTIPASQDQLRSATEVIRPAAVSDPEIEALWSDVEAKLLRVQRAIVDQLDETKSLARGLTGVRRPTSVDPRPPNRVAGIRARAALGTNPLRDIAPRRLLPQPPRAASRDSRRRRRTLHSLGDTEPSQNTAPRAFLVGDTNPPARGRRSRRRRTV